MTAPRFGARLGTAVVGALLAVGVTVTAGSLTRGQASHGSGVEQVDHIRPVATVNVAQLENAPDTATNARHLEIERPNPHRARGAAGPVVPQDALGGASAPASDVVAGGDSGGFNGISSLDMEAGGTGAYAGTNGPLEPPDQGVCTGAGYVLETVNVAMRFYRVTGEKAAFKDVPATKSIPLAQFFRRAAGGLNGPTDFISDPRCLFDHATQRWFVTILDLTSVPVYPLFNDDQNFIAVSKTSDPLGDWNIFAFDVTDNGLHGSPLHAGCLGPPVGATTLVGCLGDQPTLGTDANGIYVTDNEYALAEVFPVAPPVAPPLQQIPVLRSGVAQLYALSKQQLISGSDATLVRFDMGTVAFPGPAEDSPWASLSPAQPVPNDTTPEPAEGVEYMLSEVGGPVGHNANQVVVWAWAGTATLSTGNPTLNLLSKTVSTMSASDTFFAPDPSFPSSLPFAAYQKAGPTPLATAAGDPEEELNANDSRMSWVTLSNGTLWTAINTLLPPSPTATGHATESRVGIMYFQVRPTFAGGHLDAAMVTDGYINVPNNNVLFGTVGPRVDGATVIHFTLAGVDYFPSQAWARIDGLLPGTAPKIHVSHRGAAPEDGFTGLGILAGQTGGLVPDIPPCSPCVARWGDYSAGQVDESGCIWGANEWIPTGVHDSLNSTDWGTAIDRVCPPPVVTAGTPPPPPASSELPTTGSPPGLANTSGSGPSGAPLVAALGLLTGLVTLPIVRRRRRTRSS